MKILAIRLKNLASLAGPFELDFTAEPLASAGLFAITGPTGAGKSTLLDALCLALFGAVPRLARTGRDAKVPDADGEINTGDPRTLLRRGTGAGFAEVDFVGIDGRRYRARWEANRARDKAGGKLQNSRQSLRDLDNDQLLASQKGEYKTLLEGCLGLNFEQFTRAVLLAQSEFSAFLKADDNERSELLEKLTDTALYTRLGKRAFEKSRDARDAHRQLQDQAGGIAPLPIEEREALDQRYTDALGALRSEQARLKQLEQQRQWHVEGQRLHSEQQAASEQLQRAESHAHALSDKRDTLVRLDTLAPQRHLFSRQAELTAELQPLAARITEHQQAGDQLHTRQGQLQQARGHAHAALAAALAAQADAAPALRQAFDEQSHLARLDEQAAPLQQALHGAEQARDQGRAVIEQLEQGQQASTTRLEQIAAQLHHSAALAPLADAWAVWRPRLQQALTLSARLLKGREELPALQQRASASQAQLAERQQALDALYQNAQCAPHELADRLAALTHQLQESRQHLRSVEDLQRHWQRQQELQERQQALREQVRVATEQREARTREGLQLKGEHDTAVQQLDLTVALLNRQRLARSASVEELRAQLQDDQPCPVCGSAEHPWHQPEALLQALAGHDDSEERSARLVVEKLAARLAELRVEVVALRDQQTQLKQQEEQLQAQLDAVQPLLHAHPLNDALASAQQPAAWLEKEQHSAAQRILAEEQQQSALLKLQQQAGAQQQSLQQAQHASQEASRLLAEQSQHLLNDQQRLDEELHAFAGVLPASELEALQHTPSATFMALDSSVSQRLQQLEEQREEQHEHEERRQRLGEERLRQQGREQAAAAQGEGLAQFSQQRQAVSERLHAVLGTHPDAATWQTALEQAVQQARVSESTAAAQLQAADNEAVQLASELKAAEQRQQQLSESLSSLDASLKAWRQQHPQLDDEGLAALLAIDDPQISAMRQQLNNADKAVEQARVLLQEREQRWQAHQAHANGAPALEELDATLLVTQQQCTACEEACAELRAQQVEDQRRLSAHGQLQTRIEQAYAEFQRWGRLAALIGSAEGEKFRKLAQAYNLDLLVHHANAQLRQLVRRYRLKRGGSMLGLLVLDTEMGDELRSVHSLSGGETFLVSLALALGLASMASSTLRIESLFIDEGFGSLDPESLQLAMDALDGLQAQGRKVAVISHVQEMHERIPVQIQVKRQGNGLSDVEVVG
ncbi:AAA family ATPase [Pseudomonas sp. TE3610]